MNIESWCTVELNSKQDWLRANRKHNTNAFASSVFKGDSNQHQASRLDFKSSPEKHRERRHFPDKGKKNPQIFLTCSLDSDYSGLCKTSSTRFDALFACRTVQQIPTNQPNMPIIYRNILFPYRRKQYESNNKIFRLITFSSKYGFLATLSAIFFETLYFLSAQTQLKWHKLRRLSSQETRI